MPIKVKAAVICDDVRIEDSGKRILIGVYVGELIFDSFPSLFAPKFWIHFVPWIKKGLMNFEMKIEIPGSADIVTPLVLPIGEEKTTAEVTAQGEPLEIGGPGTLRVALRPVGGRWTEVIALAVIGLTRDARAS
jgi:hypothetical protein